MFEAIFRLSSDVAIFAHRDGTVSRINPVAGQLYGVSERELAGQHIQCLFHPDDRPALTSEMNRLLAGAAVSGIEMRTATHDGRAIPYVWRGVRLDDESGFLLLGSEVPCCSRGDGGPGSGAARFRRLAEHAPDMFFRLALPQGRYEYVSTAATQLFGCTPNEFYGNPSLIRDAIHPDWLEYFDHAWQSLVDGRVPPVCEYQIVHKSGEVRWLNQRNVVVREASGGICAIEGIVSDVTARKHAEDAARIHSDGYATLLATSHDGFLRVDAHGRIVDVNDTYLRMTGYTRKELLGLRIPDIDVREDEAKVAQRIRTAMRTGFDRFESRHRCRGGDLIDVEVSGSYWAEMGEFLLFVRDISERRRAQHVLDAERRRLHDMLDALPVYIVLLTPDYHVLFANRVFRERFGEAPGRRCFEHLFDRSEPCEVCRTYDVLKTAQPLEWEWTGPDNRNYYVYDYPFTDTDGTVYILEAGVDITELRHAEVKVKQLNASLERRVAKRTAELESANRELEAFSYSVSHDLQGPLRAINGFSRALQEDCASALDQIGQGYVERIHAASLRMGALLEGLLRLSRLARADFKDQDIDLTAQAIEIKCQLRESGTGRGAEVIIQPGLTARGDPEMLHLLLQNLLGNAWKFTASHPEACIRFESIPQERGDVFVVRDNGVGFDMQFAGRLFKPFERLHTAKEFDGTGIGLATVQRIVHRHGGEVWAESEPGKGAAFFFTLNPATTGVKRKRAGATDQ